MIAVMANALDMVFFLLEHGGACLDAKHVDDPKLWWMQGRTTLQVLAERTEVCQPVCGPHTSRALCMLSITCKMFQSLIHTAANALQLACMLDSGVDPCQCSLLLVMTVLVTKCQSRPTITCPCSSHHLCQQVPLMDICLCAAA